MNQYPRTVSLIAVIGLTVSVLASGTTWLLVTDPLTASSAIASGDGEALLRAIGAALIDMLRILVGYL